MVMDKKKRLSGHVYLIEDNDDIRSHLVTMMRYYGLVVDAFPDVASFLNASSVVEPAVIVTDMVMPGRSGLDLLKQIRQNACLSPVVFISGHSEPHQIIEAMKQGATDFLWKPFALDQLIEAVRKALEKDRERIANQFNQAQVQEMYQTLTMRERDVCHLAILGHGNNEISEILNVKPDTVKKHRARVMEKMHADSLARLIEIFQAAGLAE